MAAPGALTHGAGQTIKMPDQDIYEQSSTQKHPLGSRLQLGSRVFYYALNGAGALSPGMMCSGATIVANQKEQVQTGYSAAVGDLQVTVNLGAAPTAKMYNGGWLMVNKGTGIGGMYRIKKHTAADPSVVDLYDPVAIAWAATSEITLTASLWYKVVAFPTTATQPACGIPLISVTAAYYCWLQTWGDAPLLVDDSETVIIGEPVGKPGTHADAGSCGVVANDGTDEVWGTVRQVGAADEPAHVFLKIAP